jgi:nitroreductase
MEFTEVVRRRHMTRNFDGRPVDRAVIERILAAGLRAPSAGFTQGCAFVVLSGPEQTEVFWSNVYPDEPVAGGRWAGLRRAPVIVLPIADKQAYLERYSESDKAGLGMDIEAGWAVAYWETDAAFATMAMLLAATDQALGAAFFAIARGEAELLRALRVPEGLRPIGALALGHASSDDAPSPSVRRGRRDPGRLLHWGCWNASGH